MGPQPGKHQPHAQVTGTLGISKPGPESFGKASKTVCTGHGIPKVYPGLEGGTGPDWQRRWISKGQQPHRGFSLGRWA